MAGPGGREVGRISVRVVPDTDGFRRKLQQDLERETNGLEIEVGAGLEPGAAREVSRDAERAVDTAQAAVSDIETRLDLDTARFLRETQVALNAAEAALANIDSQIDVDQAEFLAGIEMMADNASAMLERIDAGFNVNEGEFLAQVQAMAQAAEYSLQNLDVDITPQAAGFIEAVRGFVELAEAAAGDIEVDMRVNAAGLTEDARRAVRTAEALAGPIDVGLRVDEEANHRFARRARADLSRLANSIETRIPIHIDSESARRALEREVRVIERRLATLNRSHTMRVDVMVDVDRALSRLRELDNELDRISRGVDTRNKTLGARLRGMVTSVGTGLGNMVAGVARFATRFTREIALVLAVAALIPPVLALATGAIVGLPALLAGAGIAAGAVALGFDGMKEAAKTLENELDSLKGVMNEVTQAEFTPVFKNLESVFPMLERALPKVTRGLADMAQGFVDAVTSPAGMANIENTIENVGAAASKAKDGVRDFTEGLLNLVSKVSDKFPGLADFFNETAKRFEDWVTSITKPGVDGKSSLEKMLENARGILESLIGLFGTLVDKGGELLEDEDFTQKMEDFIKGVEDFVVNTLPAMKGVFEDIAGLVSGISDTWNEIEWVVTPTVKAEEALGISNDDNTFLPNIFRGGPLGMVESMIRGLDDAKQQITQILANIAPELGKNLILPITNFFTIELPALVSTAKIFIEQKITEIGNWIKETLNPMNWFNGVQIDWSWLTNSATTAINGVKSQFATGLTGVSFAGLIGSFQTAMNSLGPIASGAWTLVTSAVSQGIDNMKAAVLSGGASMIGEVSTWPGKISSAIGSMGSILVAAGKALMDGLLSGIKQGLAEVLSFASGIAAKIASVKGPLPKDRKELIPQGEALMEGLLTGLENGLEPVLKSAGSMADRIQGAFDFSVKPIGSPVDMDQVEKDMQQQSDMIDLQTQLLNLQAQRLEQKAKFSTDETEQENLRKQASALRDQADVLALEQRIREFELEWDVDLDENLNIVPKVDMEDQGLTVMEKLQRGLEKGWVGVSTALKEMVDELGGVFGAEDYSGQLEEIGKSSGFNDIPKDFVTANATQFLSDLGGGGGALQGALTEGATYIFNVATADEADAVKKRNQDRERLRYSRR